MKPSLPKGTRDFSPVVLNKRNYIFSKIKKNFEFYGYSQIETPSFENYDTLMGKYGEEGDRLIFKILNSGDYLGDVDDELLKNKDSQKVISKICEKALRYDLTVPFARYVVMNQNDITFPFKRYQIQPVWRADRPQKGRFREFYQCDADVVGSKSLWQEVELVRLYDAVFTDLGVEGVAIKMNNRKVLSGFAEIIGQADKLVDFTVALDKLDKIGKEKVIEEMISKGIEAEKLQKIDSIFSFGGSFNEKISKLKEILKESEVGIQGIEELEFVGAKVEELGLKKSFLEIDVTLARGLNYYTGCIFEVSAPKGVQMGSIGGGGRYDNLTSIFDLKDISGVGISFGLDRIYLVMEELGLFPEDLEAGLDILLLNMGEKEAVMSMKLLDKIRDNGLKGEVYPEEAKMKKQLSYADKKGVKFVGIIGEQEAERGEISIKNMKTSESEFIKIDDLNGVLAVIKK